MAFPSPALLLLCVRSVPILGAQDRLCMCAYGSRPPPAFSCLNHFPTLVFILPLALPTQAEEQKCLRSPGFCLLGGHAATKNRKRGNWANCCLVAEKERRTMGQKRERDHVFFLWICLFPLSHTHPPRMERMEVAQRKEGSGRQESTFLICLSFSGAGEGEKCPYCDA